PAGWYPQPDGTERWWDGQTWTAHSRPLPPPPTVPMWAPVHYGSDAGALQDVSWSSVPQGYAVAPKNPGVSLIASFFLPGLGTMLNVEVGKGVGILVGYFA